MGSDWVISHTRFWARVKCGAKVAGSGLVQRCTLSGNATHIANTRYRTWEILEKWVPYSQRYLFNAIPDTNHNANPTDLSITVRVTLTLLTIILDNVVNKAPMVRF